MQQLLNKNYFLVTVIDNFFFAHVKTIVKPSKKNESQSFTLEEFASGNSFAGWGMVLALYYNTAMMLLDQTFLFIWDMDQMNNS